MERNIFDSIGLIFLMIDFIVIIFSIYKILFNKEKNINYEKVLFISFVGIFVIIGTMAVLSKLLY